MRWRKCHCCDVEEEVYREDGTITVIYECHSCWKEYCDTCGSHDTRICNQCLDEAYIKNYGYPFVVKDNDPMAIESAPSWEKQQANTISKIDWSDYE